MSIGIKIKSLRKKRGMTQNELADGIITRGMLSRIESGSAMPSMQSLNDIAKKLEVSPSFLLEEGNDIMPAELDRIAKAIEMEYKAQKYQNCLDIFELWGLEIDNKFAPVFASCAFEIALNSFYLGDFKHSKELLLKVEEHLQNTTLTNSRVSRQRIDFLRSVMDNIDSMDAAISYADDLPDFEFEPSLFLSLIKLLKDGRHEECGTLLKFCKLDDTYKSFINSQVHIKNYRFIDAILEMKAIYSKDDCPLFLKLLCLSSMENCCKLCEDYKGAYENHIAYQTLTSQINR